MAATLNQDDIKLLKSVFTTKDDLKKMERKIIKRVDLVDKSLDRTLMDVSKDVDRIKTHFNLSFPSI